MIALIACPEDDDESIKYNLNLLNSFKSEKEIKEIKTELERNKNSDLLLNFKEINDNHEKISKNNLIAYLNQEIKPIINKKSDLYIFDDKIF